MNPLTDDQVRDILADSIWQDVPAKKIPAVVVEAVRWGVSLDTPGIPQPPAAYTRAWRGQHREGSVIPSPPQKRPESAVSLPVFLRGWWAPKALTRFPDIAKLWHELVSDHCGGKTRTVIANERQMRFWFMERMD